MTELCTPLFSGSDKRRGVCMVGNSQPHQVTQMHTIPPTSELFGKRQLAERHPNLLTAARIEWALRRRDVNGLKGVVYESRSGELVIHEPGFLAWYLGLEGRAKPRAGWPAGRRAAERVKARA